MQRGFIPCGLTARAVIGARCSSRTSTQVAETGPEAGCSTRQTRIVQSSPAEKRVRPSGLEARA